MFFIQSDITVATKLNLKDIAKMISQALNIPYMAIDKSGKFEEVTVYTSSCFGLEFYIGRMDNDQPHSYHLVISSNVDTFDFDGTEKEVNATQYALQLLSNAGIKASPRDPKILY